eukprot:TRINITY_DN27495_c0_g1_i1.p1 TRINITY_DN27495_c0_g1~~TRINITY_DN27495_c0_g1_i1.p1  ORF type:complete len:112 (-),score=28.15 TRINITY_DN27495_c0_g1_i1:153-488(-)
MMNRRATAAGTTTGASATTAVRTLAAGSHPRCGALSLACLLSPPLLSAMLCVVCNRVEANTREAGDMGYNGSGQLGMSGTTQKNTPTSPTGAITSMLITAVHCGDFHHCHP